MLSWKYCWWFNLVISSISYLYFHFFLLCTLNMHQYFDILSVVIRPSGETLFTWKTLIQTFKWNKFSFYFLQFLQVLQKGQKPYHPQTCLVWPLPKSDLYLWNHQTRQGHHGQCTNCWVTIWNWPGGSWQETCWQNWCIKTVEQMR